MDWANDYSPLQTPTPCTLLLARRSGSACSPEGEGVEFGVKSERVLQENAVIDVEGIGQPSRRILAAGALAVLHLADMVLRYSGPLG